MTVVKKITYARTHYLVKGKRIALMWEEFGLYWIEGIGRMNREEFRKKLKIKVLDMNNGVVPKIEILDIREGAKNA